MDEGTVVSDRYTIVRLLGGGGIAEVYLARDAILGEEVALKVMHRHLKQSEPVLESFRREVALSRLLEHPAISRIYDVGTDENLGAVYLAMEYLPGGDLKRRILLQGALESDEVSRIGIAVLGALGAAHARGVIHRDVKPNNILFDAKGSCRLCDFGLARCGALLGLEESLRPAGTPEYLAPECAESGYADARSDLYSLGIVLYEAAAGRPPFSASTPYELMRMHAEAAPPSLSEVAAGVSPPLAQAVMRALEKDPSRRFQCAEDFARALETGFIHPLPGTEGTHVCPGCGAPVSDAFPYCFSCRREPLLIAPLQSAASGYRVVVTGPGKSGDQLGHELRYRCLGLLGDLSVDTSRLERHLPRVPFVLVRGLDMEGAKALVDTLARLGLTAEAVPERGGEGRRRIRRLLLKKDALMSGRIVAVAMGSMSGAFSGLGRSLAHGYALPAVGFLVLALLAIPVATAVRHRLPQARWRGGGRRAALRRYLELAPAVRSPALQSLTRSIVVRFQEIAARAGPKPEGETVVETAEALVLQAADWIEACQRLDDELGGTDERALYRRIADLRSAEGEDAPREEILEAERGIDERRTLEHSRDLVLDRLFAFSGRLDRLLASLGALGARGAEEEARALARAAEETELVVRAVRDVEAPG